MWNPEQYSKFEQERIRPALELISRIPDLNFKSAIDLGCGNGEITQILQRKFNLESTTGLDSSEEMLNEARKIFGIEWTKGNINSVKNNYDLIFSNAALQWLDNHELLFGDILAKANQAIAIQLPNNFNYPSHVLLRETIFENALFKSKLKHTVRESPVLKAETYFQILNQKVGSIDIWETKYLQQLSGENAVLEWVKGTALVPIKAALTTDEFESFINIYNEKLLKEYTAYGDITLFPFSRIFIIAIK